MRGKFKIKRRRYKLYTKAAKSRLANYVKQKNNKK